MIAVRDGKTIGGRDLKKVALLWLLCGAVVSAQRGAAPAPVAPQAAAPFDITGYWVALVSDEWRYRMLTPAKGNADYVPANAEGLRWDAERLDRFLADPAEMFPGLWMSIRGVEDATDRAALVRFLSDPASR